ncbi:MAG: flagellar motor switch protein FliN [bacterium]|nr:flagellar motor switch protein FliN [bacterium]
MPEEDVTEHAQQDGIELLLDVPLRVSVELGRTQMRVQELLDLGQGSIVELERLAGEAVDIMVNGHPIALGEIVVVNDRYAVRVMSVHSPTERVESLT